MTSDLDEMWRIVYPGTTDKIENLSLVLPTQAAWEIYKTSNTVYFKVPGFLKSEIKVTFEGQKISVFADKMDEKPSIFEKKELHYNLEYHEDVDKVYLENGVLRVVLKTRKTAQKELKIE